MTLKVVENSINWQSDKCLSVLQDKQLALVSEVIINKTVYAKFKPIEDIIYSLDTDI